MLLTFDLIKCIKCGLCDKVCPAYVIETEDGVPVEKHPEFCIECGHCVAVCPKEAIIHNKMDPKEFKPIIPSNISFEQFDNLTKNRRSIRRYKDKQIPEDLLLKLLDSVKFIPTASNAQELKYVIINSPDQMGKIRLAMEDKYRLFARFWPKFRMRMEKLDRNKENGIEQDISLRTSKCLIIIYSKKKNHIKNWDAGIASYHIALAVKTLGMESCLIGYHTILSNIFKSIRNASLIPKKHKVLASIAMGYPDIKYQKICSRKNLEFKIV